MKLTHQVRDEIELGISYAFGELSIVDRSDADVILDYESPRRCAPTLTTESHRLIMQPASGSYGLADRTPRGRARLEIPVGRLWNRVKIDVSSASVQMKSDGTTVDTVELSASWSNVSIKTHPRTARIDVAGTATNTTIYLGGELPDGLHISGVGMTVRVVLPLGVNARVKESGMANQVLKLANVPTGRDVRIELTGVKNKLEISAEDAHARAI